MLRICLALLMMSALFLAGCGYGSNYNGGGAGAPAITGFTPNMATAGDQAFTLTVNGSSFGTDAVVFWNGTALTSAYSSGTMVTAQVTANDVMNSGMVPVYVRSGGKNSNTLMFTVQ